MNTEQVIAYKRLCANHGVKAICIINDFVLCASFGNIIKIINLSSIDILLEYVVSSSSHVYGLLYNNYKDRYGSGILVAYCVHKIYFYSLQINKEKVSLKLISKYCTNKWVINAKFLSHYVEEKRQVTEKKEQKKRRNKEKHIVVFCLSNGSIIFVDIYKRICYYKLKFEGIHLLYSADIYIEKKKKYKFLVAGGTPFNNILLWRFKIKNIHKCLKIYENEKKKKVISLTSIGEIKGHRGIIFKVKFFKKGKYILSASDDREGRVWKKCRRINVSNKRSIKNKTEIVPIRADEKQQVGVDNNTDGDMQLLYKCEKVLTGHGARIWDIDMCYCNKRMYYITCSEDSSCNMYEQNKETYFKFSNYNGNTVRCVCFHSKCKLIISGSDNGTLYIRSIPENRSKDHLKKKEHNLSKSLPITVNEILKNEQQHFSKTKNCTNKECINGTSMYNGTDNMTSKEQHINQCNTNCRDGSEKVELKQIFQNNDSLMFMSDCMNRIMQKQDWIRSINHINISDFLICTNLGYIYILQINVKEKNMQVSLIYEEKQKEHLTTCLTFFGKDYICLGFSNGYCCFLSLKDKQNKMDAGEKNGNIGKYFKCFTHRISAMCLLHLFQESYEVVIENQKKNNISDVLHIYIKKERQEKEIGKKKDMENEKEKDKEKGKKNDIKTIVPNSDIYEYGHSCGSDFYKILYNHKEDEETKQQNRYTNNDEFNNSAETKKTFLLCNIDYSGNLKIFLVKNEEKEIEIEKQRQEQGQEQEQKKEKEIEIKNGDMKIENLFETEIDVKNKKSRIISMNYLIRQKKKKIGILFFIGDEYGCIFIIYLKIPIQIKENQKMDYHFHNIHLKSSDKIRVHNNRKVFDIQFIENYIYSCGKNGIIIKYQLFKNKDRIYTLHKLCLIKIAYYSSIYKIIPIKDNSCNTRKRILRNNENFSKKENKWFYNTNQTLENYKEHNNSEEQNIFVCCFKEKKFVLYDLKNKVEYMSIDCGGFRRPLTILINPNQKLIKTFSFGFCKEKNIYFNFKKLVDKQKENCINNNNNNNKIKNNNKNKINTFIPYQKMHVNVGFHNKSVSFCMWIKKKYLCTCSEDGTIKVVKIYMVNNNHTINNHNNHNHNINNHNINNHNINNYNINNHNNNKYSLKEQQMKNGKKSFIPHYNIYKNINSNSSFFLNKSNVMNYLLENASNFKKGKMEQNKNMLSHQMNIIQTVYNHSEPIFYMAFLKNTFYFSKKLKLIITVGAKNSANLFYVFHDIHKTPVLYHMEKLKTQVFSSNLRLLCAQGTYDVLINQPNKCVVKTTIFIGSSIGYIFIYAGIYEFAMFQNIVIPKIIKSASFVDSYNLHSTIWTMSLKLNVLEKAKNEETEKKFIENEMYDEKAGHIHKKKVEEKKDVKQKVENEIDQKQHNVLKKSSVSTKQQEQDVFFYHSDLFFVTKKKSIKRKFYDHILFCGLGNGVLQIRQCHLKIMNIENESRNEKNESGNKNENLYKYEDAIEKQQMKLILLKKMQIHKNGINEICVVKMKKLLHVFTCGDDQSIHILVIKGKIKKNNIHISVLQSSNLTNAHLSSVRSLTCVFPFLLTVSWDQHICIWKIKEQKKNEKNKVDNNMYLILEKKGHIKIATYDVCCLNAFKLKNETKCFDKQIDICKRENKKQQNSYKFDLGVSGASGSLELLRIKVTG